MLVLPEMGIRCFVTDLSLTGVLKELKLRFMSLVEVTVGLNALDMEVDFLSLAEEAIAPKFRFMFLVDTTDGLKGSAAFFLPW